MKLRFHGPRELLILALLASPGAAQEGPSETELALKKLRVAPGLKVDLFAADPMFVNPVSFSIDEKGRVYVAETHRRFTSVYEVDAHPDWLREDLAARTVEDRVAIYRRHLGTKAETLAIESERIRRLEDRTGSGRADTAVTFAEGFSSLAEGLGSSILVRGNEVWYTCVPNLWRLRDSTGEGRATERQILHTGYGVHIGSGAHDLHGLVQGPDGKIYFSSGDRGLHVAAGGRVLDCPDAGAVLRSNPDGSDLELFATGLRNPEHLAFDKYGNLFTGDNDADYGDRVRWLYVVEGGEYGWRYGYQHLAQKSPWMRERLWDLDSGLTAPYLLPPAGHLGHGPSGVAYAPGTGLPERYENHFFMCDFPGGVHSLAVRPRGAGFELFDAKPFLWELWPTDVQVGPDGAVFISDWVHGWPKSGKGRLYRVFDPELKNDPAVLETRRLIAEGMGGRPEEALAGFLGHPDRRVRQAAQFELVARHARRALGEIARGKAYPELGRLHAVWGLGQLGEEGSLLPLLKDETPEVRAQAARVLGAHPPARSAPGLIELLKDPSPRVRFFAGLALGKMGRKEAVEPLLEMVRENDDRDPFLRHSAVMGLAGSAGAEDLRRALGDPSRSVRLAVLLTLRRLERPEVASFLRDSDPALVFEAVRAIHDLPIKAALPELASLLGSPGCPDPALSRVINANYRLGGRESAERLAAYARNKEAPEAARVLAIEDLSEWARPESVDKVMGLWRPLAPRDEAATRRDLERPLRELLKDPIEAVCAQAIRAVGDLRLESAGDELLSLVKSGSGSVVRIQALRSLAALRGANLPAAIDVSLRDPDPALREEAVRWLPESGRPDAAALLAQAVLSDGPVPLRQRALLALGRLGSPEAGAALEVFLDRLLHRSWPAPLVLDLLEAGAAGSRPGLRDRLGRYEESRDKADALALFREALEGGDAKSGRRIFFERPDLSCVRCHKVKSQGGEVGPPLTAIGSQKTREYLLESIVYPNKVIAQGYGQEIVALESGAIEVGRVEKETQKELVLLLADGSRRSLAKDQIKARKSGLSAMPEDLIKALSKRDLRDLVEFLASLR
jgi:quinoprotein glucose dehydrogenase